MRETIISGCCKSISVKADATHAYSQALPISGVNLTAAGGRATSGRRGANMK